MDIRKYLNASKSPSKKMESVDVASDSDDDTSSDESSKQDSGLSSSVVHNVDQDDTDTAPTASPKKPRPSGPEEPEAKKRKSAPSCEGSFPASKLRTIMKSVPSLESVGTESLAVINKATEMFTTFLCVKGYEETLKRKSKILEYDDLSALAQGDPKLAWIQDVLSERITYAEYLAKPQAAEDDYEAL